MAVTTARIHLVGQRGARRPETARDETVRDGVGWRLLATNNRDLGRAFSTYPDLETCRAAVRQWQSRSEQLRVTIFRFGPTSWSWRIAAGDTTVVVSSRDYHRRIQASQAGAMALALFPTAEVVAPDGSAGMSRLRR
jgi:hypothetical protein